MQLQNHDAAVDLERVFGTFHQVFSPRRVAHVNDQVVKLARVRGEFVWHSHQHTDELFLVQSGELEVRYRDRTVRLGPGQLHVVPRGVEHMTYAAEECRILLVERAGTVNTGEVDGGSLTAETEPFVTG